MMPPRATYNTIRHFVVEHGMMTAQEFDELTSPQRVTRLGSNALQPAKPQAAGGQPSPEPSPGGRGGAKS
jgi:hypothetical protein